MLGAIIGDVIGSVFEKENTKTLDFDLFTRFSRFTDDTVLTIAIADALLHRKKHQWRFIDAHHARKLYANKLKYYGRHFPNAGYGQMFKKWLKHDSVRGYGSYGNGSAMRVSPIGFAFDNIDEVRREAKLSAMVSHNHREGIKGAQAIASAVYLAHIGESKPTICDYIQTQFRYDLSFTLDEIRPNYTFDSSCQNSVPQAIVAFLESDDFEDAIRKAISIGGDSDTIACMTGGIAHAYYQSIPSHIERPTKLILDASFKRVLNQFNEKYVM
ncbi:MAG: ADP-ribosylglycohydrolase family protein [Phototrophicaceae bacterium]